MVPGYLGSTWVPGGTWVRTQAPGYLGKESPNSQKDASHLLQQSFENYTQTLGNSTHSCRTTPKNHENHVLNGAKTDKKPTKMHQHW